MQWQRNGTNQTYTVEASNGLNGGSWGKVADVVAMSTDRTATVMDPQTGEAAHFYRAAKLSVNHGRRVCGASESRRQNPVCARQNSHFLKV